MTQQFKKFKIDNVFKLKNLKKLNPNDSRELRVRDKSKDYNLPGIVAKVGNNGVMYYVRYEDFEHTNNKLVVISDGAVSSGLIYYHKNDFTIIHNAYCLELMNSVYEDSNVYLYLKTVLQKALFFKYNYESKPTWSKVRNEVITLPVTSDGEIDFDYMDNYIKGVEQKYILNLRGGLDDKITNLLELTQKTEDNISDEHVQVLKEKIRLDYSQKEFKEFKVKEILNIKGTKSLNSGSINFSNVGVNFVGRTKINNGIQGKVNSEQLQFKPNMKNSITISQVGTIVALYQAEDYYTSQNIVSLNLKERELNRYIGLYFVSVLNKSLLAFEGYNTPKLNDISEFVITLPVTSDGELDYDFMGNYVRSLESIYIYMILEYVRRKELV